MASSACTFSSDDIVIKSPNDSRLIRLIELENGLQAFLVHDPEIYPDGRPKSLENGHEINEDLAEEEEEEEDEDEEDDEDDDEEEEDEEEDDDDEEEEEEEDHEVKGKGKKGASSQTKKVSVCIL